MILPWVRVPHLASHLLARMSRQLSSDWERVYAHPIYFVETFFGASTEKTSADPDCDCHEVTVLFVDSASEANAGTATVSLDTGDVRFEHDTDDEALVPGLWERLVFRHRGISLLFDRQKRMKECGKTLYQDRARPPDPIEPAQAVREGTRPGAKRKIGRNDPCPCGSGKKYKKCCLVRVSP